LIFFILYLHITRTVLEEERIRIEGDKRLEGLISDNTVLINDVKIDFGQNYYTKDNIDDQLDDYYNRDEADELLDKKADKVDTYTKDEVYNKDETYNREEIDNKIGFKIDKSEVYNKNETDNLLGEKTDKNDVYTKDEVYNKDNTYNKDEIDNKFTYSLPSPTIVQVLNGGDIVYKLDTVHSVYRFILNQDTKIFFEGVITNRHYTFYIDQTDIEHKIGIKNHLHNGNELTELNYLDNISPNTRTVIHCIGINENDENGLIINEIIPHVESKVLNGNKIIVGNILGKLYNSQLTDTAVYVKGKKTGEVYSCQQVGETVNIVSEFTNGWTHSSKGYDWVIYRKDDPNKTVLSSGLVGQDNYFTMVDINGDLILDFKVDPQLVKIEIDPFVEQRGHIERTNGFNQLYQFYYQEVHLEVIMKDDPVTKQGWFIYNMKNNIEMEKPHSFGWVFKIMKLPDIIEPNTLPTLRITPFYYKRIYEINDILINSPGENKTDLVYYEDGKYNSLDFIYNPTDSDDPITITDYDDTIKVIGTDRNIKIQIIDPDTVGQQVTFTTTTASGYSKVWNLNTIHNVDFEIDGNVISEFKNENNSKVYILRKSPSEDVEYECHIDWKKKPTYTKGYWSTIGSNNVAEVIPDFEGSDKGKIKIKSKGDVTLIFTSDFDQSKKSINIHVYVHVAAGSIKCPQLNEPYYMYTDDTFKLDMVWYDSINGNVIGSHELENPSGKYEIISEDKDRASLDELTGKLIISNKNIDGDYDILRIRFTSIDTVFNTDLPVVSESEIHVYRGMYKLTFTTDDLHTRGVHGIPQSSIQEADTLINVTLVFDNGYTVSDETEEFISTLPNVDITTISDGICRFTFNMTYNDLEIDVTSKEKEN
jgi:hypothetical protein